jgi:hypothetical protein
MNTEMIAALADPATAAQALLAVADINQDGRYRRAAGVLAGAFAGRPAVADEGSLERVAALLRDGTCKSVSRAARYVARATTGEQAAGAAAKRLARKYRERLAQNSA